MVCLWPHLGIVLCRRSPVQPHQAAMNQERGEKGKKNKSPETIRVVLASSEQAQGLVPFGKARAGYEPFINTRTPSTATGKGISLLFWFPSMTAGLEDAEKIVQTARPGERAGERVLAAGRVLCCECGVRALQRRSGAFGVLHRHVLCCQRVVLKPMLKNYCPLAVSPPESLLKAARTCASTGEVVLPLCNHSGHCQNSCSPHAHEGSGRHLLTQLFATTLLHL